jgi:6-phosphogluconolactonase
MKSPWLLAFLFASTLSAADYHIYFGSYTQGSSTSKGIYVTRFNDQTGQCSAPELAAQVENPSFLAVHPNGGFIYSVGEASVPGFKGGAVSAWKRDGATGKLSAQGDARDSLAAGPCHINLDPSGRSAVVANYSGGSTVSYQVKEDGSLTEAVSHILHSGSSVNAKRQKEPHAHSANFSADGKFVFVADLGIDQVISYSVDPSTAKLSRQSQVSLPAGCGPRHLSFHPNGKVAFTNGELLMNVTSLDYDAASGGFTPLETISCMPKDYVLSDKDSTAEVLTHPNGRYVYVSVRGQNQISRLSYDAETRKMQHLGNTPSGGKTPRNFALDPSGRWLFAAHQGTPRVVIFAVNQDTGGLTPSGQELSVDACVCVRFVPIK